MVILLFCDAIKSYHHCTVQCTVSYNTCYLFEFSQVFIIVKMLKLLFDLIIGLTASVINIKLEKKASPFSQPKSVQPGTTQEKLEAKIKQLEDCMGCVVWTSLDDSLEVHGKRAAPVVDCYEVRNTHLSYFNNETTRFELVE